MGSCRWRCFQPALIQASAKLGDSPPPSSHHRRVQRGRCYVGLQVEVIQRVKRSIHSTPLKHASSWLQFTKRNPGPCGHPGFPVTQLSKDPFQRLNSPEGVVKAYKAATPASSSSLCAMGTIRQPVVGLERSVVSHHGQSSFMATSSIRWW